MTRSPADWWQVKSLSDKVDVIERKVDDLKTLFLSINRRLNGVDELYRMFTGKDVGRVYEDDDS